MNVIIITNIERYTKKNSKSCRLDDIKLMHRKVNKTKPQVFSASVELILVCVACCIRLCNVDLLVSLTATSIFIGAKGVRGEVPGKHI